MSVCTKERKGVSAEVLMATPCTNSLGGESGGHRHEGGEGAVFLLCGCDVMFIRWRLKLER